MSERKNKKIKKKKIQKCWWFAWGYKIDVLMPSLWCLVRGHMPKVTWDSKRKVFERSCLLQDIQKVFSWKKLEVNISKLFIIFNVLDIKETIHEIGKYLGKKTHPQISISFWNQVSVVRILKTRFAPRTTI